MTGEKVRYVRATDDLVRWGGNDPRGYLHFGKLYTLKSARSERSVTLYQLAEYPDCWFNGACFDTPTYRPEAENAH